MRNKLCLTHSSREFSGTLHSLLYEERPDYANAIDNSHFLRLIGELDFVADQSGAVDEAGLRKHAPDIGEAKGEHGDITIITTEELQTRKVRRGHDVWQWRWYDEKGKRKAVIVGTTASLPTKAAAERAVEPLRLRINSQLPQARLHPVTVNAVLDRYLNEVAPREV